MKRLYEREVKLGYNKMLNPDKVQTSTNIDNALREWQVTKAEELGFTNLKELNKQTQISRNLINSLGDEVVGKTGLNNVSLTDWIMLSGGDPTAIGGFLTKKFFGSKGVQAKIAEMLSDVAPEGIKKPVVTPSKLTPQPQSKILQQKPLAKSTTPRLKVKGAIPDKLSQEAAKYKTADEFVKAQPKLFHGGTADIKEVNTNKGNFNKTFYLSDNADYAKSYGGKNSSLNEISISPNANLADMRNPNAKLINDIEKIISPKSTGEMVKIQKPDGSFIEVPKTKGGISEGVYSTKQIIQGIKDGKAMFAESPEVKTALKKLGYDGQITQESKYGANYGVWNKDVVKTKSQLTDIWNKANKK